MDEIGLDLHQHIRTIPGWPKPGYRVVLIIDLPDLGGSGRLREAGLAVHSFCAFAGE